MESDHLPIKRSRTKSAEKSGQLDRSLVQKWSKEELEDKLLNLYYEHSQQKAKVRELEDANRNYKVANAKMHDQVRRVQAQSGAGAAELRATDQVAKLELRLLELERQNAQLQSQATLRKTGQSTTAGAKRRGSYRGGGGAVSSSARLSRSMSGAGGVGETLQLQREVESLREQLSVKDLELRAAFKEAHSEREVSQVQASGGKLVSMQDDLDRVRLQRLLREKSAVVDQMQIKCETLEERIRDLQSTNAVLMQTSEQSRLAARMREQDSSASLESSAMGQVTQKRLLQLEHALEDAKAEAQVLRESNEKLISSAFDTHRERQWRAREMALMAQIRQLEAGRQSGGPDAATSAGGGGTGQSELELERELSTLRVRYYELQMQQQVLEERLKAADYRKQGITDEEFRAALALAQKRHELATELNSESTEDLAFLKPTTDIGKGGGKAGNQRRLLELEAAYADAMLELEKTRELLKAQQLLNSDTKAGHSLTEFRLQEVRSEYEAKIGELNQLLEIRAARIRQLEQQLASATYSGKAPQQQQEEQLVSRQRAEPQLAQLPPGKQPAGSSPAGSVVEESCVEQIHGVAESAYRQFHSKARPTSSKVVSAMAARIDAPPDRQLPADGDGASESGDNESVHSVVAAPVKVKPGESARVFTKESIQLAVDASINKLADGQQHPGHAASLPPPPPYEEPYTARLTKKIRAEEEQGSMQQQQQQQQPPSPPPPLLPDDEESDSEEPERRTDNGDDAGEDSDAVVVLEDAAADDVKSQSPADASSSKCYVQVFEVHLEHDCKALTNPDLDETGCYVAFDLPGYKPEAVETPLSIRTPRPGVSKETEYTLRYNFKRIYDFDFDKNYSRRTKLAALLVQQQPALTFTLVCEALDGSDFFLDLARAKLPLAELIEGSQRVIDRTLTLSASDTGERVGDVKVGLDLPNLLRAIRKELP